MVVGLAITVALVVVFNPVLGDQVYVLAPLVINVALLPLQIVAELGVIVKVGPELTVITTVFVFIHPFAFAPVTV